MPPQHVEIAETIFALKRALRREKEAPSDQLISSATNRGNKLKRGANHVHAGSLPYHYEPHGYKQRIEHAGYQRYILERNPARYNEYGDELEESESDEDADAGAENPYSDLRIEELLRPLTHPADLANHPTLSIPYLDPALAEMVDTTEAQLRQERANLWRAKNLQRQFIGDESWMPCGNVEAADDWDLFEPVKHIAASSSSKKRKRSSYDQMAEQGITEQDHAKSKYTGVNGQTTNGLTNGVSEPRHADDMEEKPNEEESVVGRELYTEANETENKTTNATDDTDVLDDRRTTSNGIHTEDVELNADPEEKRSADDLQDNTEPNGGSNTVEGVTFDGTERPFSNDIDESNGDNNRRSNENENNDNDNNDNDNDNSNDDTPLLPTRRITRALAAADTSNAPTPPLSPATSTISSLSSGLFQPAPLFLLPNNLTLAHTTHPSSHLPLHVAHSGLPPDEILETRRLLGMFIQKQEETIRGLEGVLGKLIKAKRMKDKVWEWCKAEGHVGEWSDGEDWVDAEAWELRPDELRKGRDEEEQELQEEGRKGKRRRGRE